MSVSAAWSQAFPQELGEKVVRTLVEGFHELASSPGGDFRFSESEPRVTKRLARHLETIRPLTLVTGFWNYERHVIRTDLTDERRLDITYSTVVDNKTNVDLIFECKKLFPSSDKKAKQYRRSYCSHGIARFVQGSYAPLSSIAFMVGFVEAIGKGAVDAIRSVLAVSPATWLLQDYGLGEAAKPLYWQSPPFQFDAFARFETRHLRALPLPDITLYHMELAFPA